MNGRYAWSAVLRDGTKIPPSEASFAPLLGADVAEMTLHPFARADPLVAIRLKPGERVVKFRQHDTCKTPDGGGEEIVREAVTLVLKDEKQVYLLIENSGRIWLQSSPDPPEPPLPARTPWCDCGETGACVGCRLDRMAAAEGADVVAFLRSHRIG